VSEQEPRGCVGGEGGRVYGGRSGAQRRADRRARLVQAGLELFGTEGWHAVSIERLCTQASVATRSFYEEFPGRESLIQAVYDEVIRTAGMAVRQALACRADAPLADRLAAGVGAYVDHLTEDPRRARIAYREVRAVGGLEQHRHDVMMGFSSLIEPDLHGQALPVDPGRRRVLTLALAGAVSEVLVDWVAAPEPRPPLAPVREELSRLFAAALSPAAGASP
jgi:AcrR family transcriptional regulator